MIHTGRDIQKRAGPAACVVADAGIFQIPHRQAPCAQITRSQILQLQSRKARKPAPAMDHDNKGKRPRPFRQPELAKLMLAGSVGDLVIGQWALTLHQHGKPDRTLRRVRINGCNVRRCNRCSVRRAGRPAGRQQRTHHQD